MTLFPLGRRTCDLLNVLDLNLPSGMDLLKSGLFKYLSNAVFLYKIYISVYKEGV